MRFLGHLGRYHFLCVFSYLPLVFFLKPRRPDSSLLVVLELVATTLWDVKVVPPFALADLPPTGILTVSVRMEVAANTNQRHFARAQTEHTPGQATGLASEDRLPQVGGVRREDTAYSII